MTFFLDAKKFENFMLLNSNSNYLRQTLILTRLSSLGVGVSRPVMSDQRERIAVQDRFEMICQN